MSTSPLSVARYLEHQLAICGKPQKEIAESCGYANANIITMFKNGKTKIPLVTVGPLASALGVDAGYLLRLVIQEYMPDVWTAIESILGRNNLITQSELDLIHVIREASGGRPIDSSNAANRKDLAAVAKKMADRDQKKADAAVKRLNQLPKNARHKGV